MVASQDPRAFTGTPYAVTRMRPGAGQGQLQTARGWRIAVGMAWPRLVTGLGVSGVDKRPGNCETDKPAVHEEEAGLRLKHHAEKPHLGASMEPRHH